MKRNTEATRQNIRQQMYFLYSVVSELNTISVWTDEQRTAHKKANRQIRLLSALLGERG